MATTSSPTRAFEPGAATGQMPANALPHSPVPGPAPWSTPSAIAADALRIVVAQASTLAPNV